MEERLDRLEREISLLKKRAAEVYLVSKYDNHSEQYDNIGIFVNPKDAYYEAVDKSEYGYVDFSMDSIYNLEVGRCYSSGGNRVIIVKKLLLQ